jgi:hypothetical protein
MPVIALTLVPVLAVPAAVVVTASSAVGVLFGVLGMVALVGLDSTMWVLIQRRYRTEMQHPTVLDATPDELRLIGGTNPAPRIKRAHLARVVRLTASEISGNRIQFQDVNRYQIGVWDVGWMAGLILAWVADLGYETSWLRERHAIEASQNGAAGLPAVHR